MPTPSSPGPLPLRWALILVAAAVAALLAGGLTFARTVSWPAVAVPAAFHVKHILVSVLTAGLWLPV